MKTSSSKRLLRNSRGQFVIEGVLLMIISASALVVATKYIREKQWLSHWVSTPWSMVAGMIESGVWADATTAKAEHPNQIARHRSPFPKGN